MSRPKGPGAIKHLDVKEHDEVDMRRILYRGEKDPPTPDELKHNLKRLSAERERLTTQLLKAPSKGLARALDNVNKQIEETRERIKKGAASPNPKKAVFAWQERAVAFMSWDKALDPDPDADHVSSPHGSKITPHDLQRLLSAEGFDDVGLRELRRFMRRCGAFAGQQGKRTDLRRPASGEEDRPARGAAVTA
jgi:hypothetical protein